MYTEQNTEALLLDVVRTLRQNPAQYERVRMELRTAPSDEERVRRLLNLATSEQDLAALIPDPCGNIEVAAWTTVTVTTVFILADSAY